MTYKREEISELLSLYDTDDLSRQEREAVEQHLANDEDVRSELVAQRAMQEMFSEMGKSLHRPEPDVFKRIEANVDALTDIPSKSTESLYKKVGDFFRSLLPKPQFAWGIAAVQMAVLVLLISTSHQESSYQTLSHNPAGSEQLTKINIVFDPASMEQDIRALLRTIDASIIEGPTEEGLYVIAIPSKTDQDTLLKTLRNSKITLIAEVAL